MFEILILLALIGSVLAGLWDLATTEVPDEIPAVMIVLGLSILFVLSVATGNFFPFFVSLIIGTVSLLIGLVMFKAGMWGEADAWILASIAYLIPFFNGLFIIPFAMNLVITSMFYMIIYAIILGLLNIHIFRFVWNDLKKNYKIVVGVPAAYFAFMISMFYMRGFVQNVLVSFLLITFLVVFWRYAKVLEEYVFRKRVRAKELKIGDVLEETNWIGINEKQIMQIQKKKKYVTIKDGVRFVPVFAIALILTLLYGNILFALLGLV